jgi:hypothetical protein
MLIEAQEEKKQIEQDRQVAEQLELKQKFYDLVTTNKSRMLYPQHKEEHKAS